MEKQEKTVLPRSERLENIRAWFITILFFPFLIPVIFVLGYFLAAVFVGAFYLGPMLGLFIMAPLRPVLQWLQVSASVTDKIQTGIWTLTCTFGVFFMVSYPWK